MTGQHFEDWFDGSWSLMMVECMEKEMVLVYHHQVVVMEVLEVEHSASLLVDTWGIMMDLR